VMKRSKRGIFLVNFSNFILKMMFLYTQKLSLLSEKDFGKRDTKETKLK
jgi:hypothetical protein